LPEEERDLGDLLWEGWAADLTAWLRAPQFERFEEIDG
jgi:hypothetical protein